MTRIDISTLADRIGQEIAVSQWMEIDQARVNQFADATGDHQWIHVDPARAADSPFKSTIAHGFLTLSLISSMLREAVEFGGLHMAINYGLNRVRFVSPVPTGSRIRGRFVLAAVKEAEQGWQATWQATVERDGAEKPCLVAEWLVRYHGPGRSALESESQPAMPDMGRT